jgi:TRAP-type C4-dicarboxylate transport system substrate-binding protein
MHSVGSAADQGTIIKIATLAPEGSTWVNIFNTIDDQIRQKTGDQVGLRIYPGGVLGDEKDMLRKMNIGQIHGAALSSPGLSTLFKELDIFQIPFLFQTYGEVDYILTHMSTFFKRGLAANGYILLGWSEGGFVRLMTTSPATTLEELKRLKVWNWEEAPISKAIFDEAGVTGIPLSVPDVLVGLQTGLVDVVYAPPAGAIALQWFTRVKYILDLPLLYMAGGVVVKQSVFQGLAADHQKIVQAVFDEYMPILQAAIRQDNQEALQIMAKHGVQTLKPPPDQIEVFKQLSTRALTNLPGSTFSPQTLAQVHELLEKYRAGTQ